MAYEFIKLDTMKFSRVQLVALLFTLCFTFGFAVFSGGVTAGLAICTNPFNIFTQVCCDYLGVVQMGTPTCAAGGGALHSCPYPNVKNGTSCY
jgi:hypothetical protein